MRVATLLILLVAVAGCHSVRQPEAPKGPHFTVVTYNVNFGGPRPDLAVRTMQHSKADIICLQETTPEWESLLRSSLTAEYPFMHFRHSTQRAAGGCAFLAKWRSTEVAYIPSNS